MMRCRLFVALCLFVLMATFGFAQTPPSDTCLDYAKQILSDHHLTDKVVITLDAQQGNREAFSITSENQKIHLSAGGSAGVLYGVQEIVKNQNKLNQLKLDEKPDFELRGNALFLMKEGSYNFQLTPKEFPWFYNRPLLTKYLDYLCSNRFNAIFLWSGCLWPSIVEMPEYPDATDLSREQLLENQAQFRWFTDECAKRNISVLMHFYSIQIPGPMAKARKIPLNYSKPTEFTAKLIHYCLTRFLTEFKSVGLYVCPGEALDPKYTAQWINDVIFTAAKECGHNPTIVVRDWGLDAEGFTKQCIGKYDNLFTELKHNVEMIVSPVPDKRHAIWRNVGLKHIVNVHEVSDVKPLRWGSPTFIQEMVNEWRKAGINGAEVYGMVSWRWPYSLDKLETTQQGFWPDGNKLLTFERDSIWLASIGRYLWKIDRSPKAEAGYWRDQLAEKYDSKKVGDLIRRWYDLTGPILPGLQNVTSVLNMNYHPTVVGKEQMIDAILSARVPAGSKARPTTNYGSQPVDTSFFEQYKREYKLPKLVNRMSMPVSEYALAKVDNKKIVDAMTPDKIAALLVKMAVKAKGLAEDAHKQTKVNVEEAQRFVTDSEALVLITKAWECKINAAIAKGKWLKTHDSLDAKDCLKSMRESITIYTRLVELTDRTYVNPTDMLMDLNWHNGLKAFKDDLAKQEKVLGSQ